MKNMTIKLKLITTMLIMAILLVVVGLLGMNGIRSSNNIIVDSFQNKLPAIEATGGVNQNLLRARIIIARAIAHPDGAPAEATVKRAEDFAAKAQQNWQKLIDISVDKDEKLLLDKIAIAKDQYINEGFTPVLQAYKTGNFVEADRIAMSVSPGLFNSFAEKMDKLSEHQAKNATDILEASESTYVVLLWVNIIGIVIGVLVAIFSTYFLLKSIINPLQFVIEQFHAMGSGNLSKKISAKSQDEIGELLCALEEMRSNLSQTVAVVRDGSASIALSSQEIASGNLDLSSRTENQAASLEETASSMEELTSTVQQNAENARQANTLAISASEVASKGGQVVGSVVDTMLSIKTSSGKIVDIIGVIDGIAFQTNILALNAAVEAARAGEQGRGFAVVASEVRNLAQRSAGAAKEIKELINDSVNKVEEGSRLVDQAGQTMDQIVVSIRGVADIMAEITAASAEQSDGIAQVNVAILQMDEVTQQNAALVEEAAAAAGSMQEQAENLNQAVSIFKLESDNKTSGYAAKKNGQANVMKMKPIAQNHSQNKPQAKPKSITTHKVESRSTKKDTSTDDDWEEF